MTLIAGSRAYITTSVAGHTMARESAICTQRTAMAPCELSPSVTAADQA